MADVALCTPWVVFTCPEGDCGAPLLGIAFNAVEAVHEHARVRKGPVSSPTSIRRELFTSSVREDEDTRVRGEPGERGLLGAGEGCRERVRVAGSG